MFHLDDQQVQMISVGKYQYNTLERRLYMLMGCLILPLLTIAYGLTEYVVGWVMTERQEA